MIKLSVPIRHIDMGLVEERALKISLQVQFQRVEMTAGALEDRTGWQKHRMRESSGLVKRI